MCSPTLHSVVEASQVGAARRDAIRLAEETGFGETEIGQIAIVVTELGNNLVRYAQDGKLLLRSFPSVANQIFEILTVDRGPGQANFDACLADGFSSGGTPGNGLGAVHRLSRTFDYFSKPALGTVVLSQIAGPGTSRAEVKPRFVWGVISVPAPHETVCGDAWRLDEAGGNLRLMLADGLGHGMLAAEAAEKACHVFERLAPSSPKSLIEQSHAQLSSTRGAALAAAYASGSSPALQFAGIGNISGSIQSLETSRGLMSHNGTVGVHMRSVQELTYPWPAGAVLVMHSDGLKNRWSFSELPGLLARHPAVIAAVLWRDFGRGKDDATVLVVRRLLP